MYVLLQEMHTPTGVIYDWTLPQRLARADRPQVLGEESALAPLVFPLNPVAGAGAPDTPPQRHGGKQPKPAVLALKILLAARWPMLLRSGCSSMTGRDAIFCVSTGHLEAPGRAAVAPVP